MLSTISEPPAFSQTKLSGKTGNIPALACHIPQSGALVIRDQVRDHDVATPALLGHKEPASIIEPFRACRGFGCDELVIYGIRELA